MNVALLPVGWTQHVAPTGHVYYHNATTNQSTYTRPALSFANMQSAAPAAPKKDKPLVKTPIPGTEWIRVKTIQGNTFYNNKTTKASIWTVPEEIREAVSMLEKEEEELRRTAETSKVSDNIEGAPVKRKAEASHTNVSKKAKTNAEEEDEDEESEEEEWQQEAAAQLAAEAEAAEQSRKEEERQAKEEARRAKEEMEEKAAKLNLPKREDLSLEEAKALFKTLLQEKDINPLQPWDMSLPLFVSDPRYGMLNSVAARRDVFDEFCRERARELRDKAVKEQRETADPKEAFEKLLREQVTSTRTSWTDWRRTWKKDRRFYGWGRDDREREKRFRDFLKELGERKRADAQRHEADFIALLRESNIADDSGPWKTVKAKISNDPRYDAVGSSTLREELYTTFMKAQATTSSPAASTSIEKADKGLSKEERRERAMREREAQVSAERNKVNAAIDKSKLNLDREEGEAIFRTMLTDAIHDPQATWDSATIQLGIDPRFSQSPLPLNQRVHLFHTHIAQLRSKHLANLHSLFGSYATTLITSFKDLPISSLMASLPVTKLGYSEGDLHDEYERWQREQQTEARKAFDQMLQENAFVDFWSRLAKMGGEGVGGGVKADEDGEEDEGEGGGGKADMKALAKTIDIGDLQKVLKNDKRYTTFDHIPEVRERWLRDYIANLSAPKLSVHLGESA